SLFTEYKTGNPAILFSNLSLILVEASSASSQYGKVDVDQKLLVLAFRQRRMTSSQDVILNPRNALFGNTGPIQFVRSPLHALSFVVASPDVIDGIMKPK